MAAEKGETDCCYYCCSTYCSFCLPPCLKYCPCFFQRNHAKHPKILYGSLSQQEDEVDESSESSGDLPSIPVTKIFQFPQTLQQLSPHPQIGDDEHGFKRPVIAEQPKVVRGMSMTLQNDGFSFDPNSFDEVDGKENDIDEEDESDEMYEEDDEETEEYEGEYYEDDQDTSGMSTRESSTSSKQYADDDDVSSDESSYGASATMSASAKVRGSICYGRIERTPEHTLERNTVKSPLMRSSHSAHASMYRNVLAEINQKLITYDLVPDVPVTPSVHFALYYDKKSKCITVHISKAVNLCTSFPVANSNPFMMAYLLPSKSMVQQSPSVKSTYNPLFNYVFKFFGMDDEAIKSHVLVIKLYINDINHFIGGVVLELEDADLYGTAIVKELCQFDEHCSAKESYQGDVLISLCFHSSTRILTVRILEACNLRKKGTPGIPNPYIKVNLIYNGERIFKLKTSKTKERRIVNPVINEKCEVLLSTLNTDSIQVDIMVMSYDRFSHNELVGSLSIGTQAQQISGKIHWKEVMNQHDKTVSRWHAIFNASIQQSSLHTSGSLPKRLVQVSGMQI